MVSGYGVDLCELLHFLSGPRSHDDAESGPKGTLRVKNSHEGTVARCSMLVEVVSLVGRQKEVGVLLIVHEGWHGLRPLVMYRAKRSEVRSDR